jgi:hypothetical protein
MQFADGAGRLAALKNQAEPASSYGAERESGAADLLAGGLFARRLIAAYAGILSEWKTRHGTPA